MRKFTFFLALILVFAFMQGPSMAREETTISINGKNLGGYPYADYFDEDDMASDSAYGVASQQSVKAYVDNLATFNPIAGVTVVVIDEDDLSTLTSQAATSGQSVFWLDWGYFYVVDVMSLSNLVFNEAGTVFSAVTAIAPKVTAANDGKTFGIMWGYPSGSTNYSDSHSGLTYVQVVPYAEFAGAAAATSYYTPGQTVQSIYEPTGWDVTTGGSVYYVNRLGDAYVGKACYNSGASIQGIFEINH
jgi:hypothetical protein